MSADQAVSSIPLLRHKAHGATFAWRGGNAVSAARFVAEAGALAARLPEQKYVLNLCADRYRFAVGFSAAMLRGQISLLPPNHTPDLIRRLSLHYPGLYCLSDGAQGPVMLPTVAYPDLSGAIAPTAMPEIPAAQVAAIVFTSGSTGDPMPNEKTWGALARNVTAEAGRLGILERNDLTLLGTVPPQHMYGFESTVLIALQSGVMMHADKPFYPADIVARLNAISGARALVTTPVHLRTLLASGLALPAVEQIVCATAPLSRDLAAQAEQCFGAQLHEIYGFTEAGQVASRRTALTDEWRTFDGLSLRRQGEVTYVSGGHVAGELPLNDIIELHSDTTFLLHGRTADLINIAGKRTSLASLNHHLNAIAGVRDGAFFMPDEKDGETARLVAFVVAPALSNGEITNALRQRIDPIFLPRPIVRVDALPRNATGKLPRASLELLLRQSRGAEVKDIK
ncbi:MAG: AMP-binding protein [Nitrosomonadales bacterium]|nr:AMP-binding protein [Nitrosomonadales bacterium]